MKHVEDIISKAELEDEYTYFKKPIHEIARDHKVDEYVIRRALIHYNIPERKEPEKLPPNTFVPIRHHAKSGFADTLQKCRDYGITYAPRHHNTILFHDRNETWKHLIAKCIAAKILRDDGHEIFTELKHRKAITDLIDVTTGVCYEFETNVRKGTFGEKKAKIYGSGLDLVVIDLKLMPDGIVDIIQFIGGQLII